MLLAAIKMLKSNLTALQMCKMQLADILEPSDLQEFKTFSDDYLSKIENFDGKHADS